MNSSVPGFHHQLLELAQIHVHQVGDAIQPSHPLLSPSPPAFDLSRHQGLFQGVSSLLGSPQILPRGSRLRQLCSCKYRLPFMEEERWVRWWRSASKMGPAHSSFVTCTEYHTEKDCPVQTVKCGAHCVTSEDKSWKTLQLPLCFLQSPALGGSQLPCHEDAT